MLGKWLKGLFVRSGPNLCTIRSREAALTLPTQLPLDVVGQRRNTGMRCSACKARLVETLFTTFSATGDPELWREHPVAIDGWACPKCGSACYPRLLEPDEAVTLGREGAAHGEAGRLDEAELAFRRVSNSWPKFAPGRANVAAVYEQRVKAEYEGENRPVVMSRLLNVLQSQARDALKGDALPDVQRVVMMVARAHLQREAEGEARLVVEEGAARPGLTDEEKAGLERLLVWVNRRGDLYDRGTQAINPYMRLFDRPVRPIDDAARRRIVRGVEDLLRYQRANTESWQALWIAGKGKQALGDHEGAAELFKRAYDIKKDVGVAREYALALLELERFDEAEAISRSACDIAPADSSLVANLAVVLLLQAKVKEAEEVASRALRMDESDKVTTALLGAIREIRDGLRPQPTTLAQLERRRG